MREFQKYEANQTPGPCSYGTTNIKTRSISSSDVPFMSKQTRNTIFSGKFKLYSKEFVKDMANTGEKIGPGPAFVNVREYQDKNVIRKTKNMSKSRR